MVRAIIKYVGITLVIVGILLVMKNLFSKDTNSFDDDEKVTYSAMIKLLDMKTNDYLEGARLILRDSNDNIIDEWVTENKVHVVNNLEKGEYTLIQESALEYYHLSAENVEFKISNSDRNVVMYNVRMTEEEIRNANTTSNEVDVDNTLSTRNILTVIMSFVLIGFGIKFIYKVKKGF